ncbi:protein of unknown function [Thauera humireducens]|uniref:hypothetical protein n=1 Tax=Thauera humireducens TaxID=1134435 RepID=UPI002467AA19|nr:hypothetical protein [Thauera humireducens]CAH1746835.1 protein of unknown function [Thauera humireducens]
MEVQTEAHFIQAQKQWGPLLDAAATEHNRLVIAVASHAMSRGLSFQAFQAGTGLSAFDLAVLVTGQADFSHLLDDAVPALAKFLGWPPIAVKAMAGQVLLSDFYTETELTEQPALMASRLDAPALLDVPEPIAVFAGVLACLDARKRKAIREVCADGPPERH